MKKSKMSLIELEAEYSGYGVPNKLGVNEFSTRDGALDKLNVNTPKFWNFRNEFETIGEMLSYIEKNAFLGANFVAGSIIKRNIDQGSESFDTVNIYFNDPLLIMGGYAVLKEGAGNERRKRCFSVSPFNLVKGKVGYDQRLNMGERTGGKTEKEKEADSRKTEGMTPYAVVTVSDGAIWRGNITLNIEELRPISVLSTMGSSQRNIPEGETEKLINNLQKIAASFGLNNESFQVGSIMKKTSRGAPTQNGIILPNEFSKALIVNLLRKMDSNNTFVQRADSFVKLSIKKAKITFVDDNYEFVETKEIEIQKIDELINLIQEHDVADSHILDTQNLIKPPQSGDKARGKTKMAA